MFAAYTSYYWQSLSWQPAPQQLEQLQQTYQLVCEGNRVQNLTRLTGIEDFWEKHLWDSLRGILPLWEQENLTAIDIGTGAGFPGVPIAIARPSWQVTLLDSSRKKITFVKGLLEAIALTNATAQWGRAESLHALPTYARQYDLAIVRAVADAETCAGYALPLLKPGGTAILYRGHWTEDEQTILEKHCRKLGASLQLVEAFTTPLTEGIRHCVHLKQLR